MCSSVSFPCPQLLQEISPHSGLGLQENISSRHGEPVPHPLPSSVSPSSCGSFSTCEHFALSEHCLPQCATSVAAGLTTCDISDGERGEKVGERGWSLGDVCLRYSASSSLYTLSSRGSTHYLPQFCSQNIAAWDKWFSSPSWSISEGSAHWVFWALSWGIWSDGENMWKIMGWSKCLHVWITITPLLWKGFKYFWRVHLFKNDLLYSTFFPWLLTCQS